MFKSGPSPFSQALTKQFNMSVRDTVNALESWKDLIESFPDKFEVEVDVNRAKKKGDWIYASLKILRILDESPYVYERVEEIEFYDHFEGLSGKIDSFFKEHYIKLMYKLSTKVSMNEACENHCKQILGSTNHTTDVVTTHVLTKLTPIHQDMFWCQKTNYKSNITTKSNYQNL